MIPLRRRLQLPEEAALFGTAMAVGIGAGLAAIAFRYLIAAVEWIGYGWLPGVLAQGRIYVVVAPAAGGLVVGLLVHYFAREAKGHGVPEVMEAVALRAGVIRNFTGIDSPYEPPEDPEIAVDTSKMSVDECVEELLAYLKRRGILIG